MLFHYNHVLILFVGYQNVGSCWIVGNCVLLCDVSENEGYKKLEIL